MAGFESHWDTFLQVDPDFSQQDLQAEIARLFQRQRAIDALLRGEMAADTLGDMLAEHGIDPYSWMSESLDNVAEDCPECLGFL